MGGKELINHRGSSGAGVWERKKESKSVRTYKKAKQIERLEGRAGSRTKRSIRHNCKDYRARTARCKRRNSQELRCSKSQNMADFGTRNRLKHANATAAATTPPSGMNIRRDWLRKLVL